MDNDSNIVLIQFHPWSNFDRTTIISKVFVIIWSSTLILYWKEKNIIRFPRKSSFLPKFVYQTFHRIQYLTENPANVSWNLVLSLRCELSETFLPWHHHIVEKIYIFLKISDKQALNVGSSFKNGSSWKIYKNIKKGRRRRRRRGLYWITIDWTW